MDIYDQNASSVNISERLKKIREERGLSIRALGRLSGLSANALSVIERGFHHLLSAPSIRSLLPLRFLSQLFLRNHPRSRMLF